MNSIKKLTDKQIIEIHFRKNTPLNVYSIGDLDDFFIKYSTFYGLTSEDEIKEIVLLYNGTELPVLLAMCGKNQSDMKELIEKVKIYLPDKFYSHLSPGLENSFSKNYSVKSCGRHFKMSLEKINENILKERSDDDIRRINSDDYKMLKEFYEFAYPDNWFDERMLETGKYFGYFTDGKITGAAGIHVYSQEYRVAALGNITTAPELRGNAIGIKLTSALCKDLFKTVDLIGLNVHIENSPAIKCYKNCGFEITDEYEEFMIEKSQ